MTDVRHVSIFRQWECEVSQCGQQALYWGHLDEDKAMRFGDFHVARVLEILQELYGNLVVCDAHKNYLVNAEVIQ